MLLSLLLLVSAIACNAERVSIPSLEPSIKLTTQSTTLAGTPTNHGATLNVLTPTTSTESASIPSDQVERISIEQLKAMMDSGENVVILDVRKVEYFRISHIPGAISFPWKPALTTTDLDLIPSGETVVTYCQCGPGEADGADMAWKLMNLGVKNVKTLAHPSIQGWISAGYPTE